MITRIEIDGFKSFKDFAVDLAPLTVIAGPNASGKSNLFDALRFLKGLAEGKQFPFGLHGRGGADDLFTKYDSKERATAMTFAVEFLLPSLFKGQRISHPRLRYEVRIGVEMGNDFDEPFVWHPIIREKLLPIETDKDIWVKKYLPEEVVASYGLPQSDDLIFRDRHSGEEVKATAKTDTIVFGTVRAFIPTSAISEASSMADPILMAVRKELTSFRFLELDRPNNFTNYGIRNPSNDPNETLNILVKLKKTNPDNFQFLSSQLNRIVSGLGKIDVYTDELNRSTLTVSDLQGRRFLFESLSEGTLRIIALATRLVEENMHHVLLLEEPENGIDPLRLESLVQLLTNLSAHPDTNGNDLRQIICTTHSPVLLRAMLKEEKGLVLLCSKPTYLFDEGEKRHSLKVTQMRPVLLDAKTNKEAEDIDRFTLLQAMNYFKELQIEAPDFSFSAHA